MKKIAFKLALFFIANMLCFKSFAVDPKLTDLPFAYGEQLWNSTFDGGWETTNNEPVNMTDGGGWHSFNTAYFASTSAKTTAQFGASNDVIRPGSAANAQSAKVSARYVLVTTANGNATTGQIYANVGVLTSTADSRNLTKCYNRTVRTDAKFNTPFTSKPDSVAVWVNFQPTNTTTQYGRISIFIHGDADFQDPPSSQALRDQVVAFAGKEFIGTNGWVRLSIPFQYDSYESFTDYTNSTLANNTTTYQTANVEPKYIIATMSTNKIPGGDKNDVLYVDDILMIYNPTLAAENTSGKSVFRAGDEVNIAYTITGTMSPYNLNAEKNAVSLELSDATGSFDNAVVLDKVTTDESGVFNVTLPEKMEVGNYKLRVVTTNYPMTSDEIGIEIYDVPSIDVSLLPQPTCDGSNITAAVDIISENGSAVTAIAWKLDGTEIGNTATLSYPVNYADNGKILTVEVTNACGTTTSEPMTIVVNRTPAPTGNNYVGSQTEGTGNWVDLVKDYTGTLIWYDNPTGGSSVSAPATFDKNVPQNVTYYVSQIVDGCESPRTAVSVRIELVATPPSINISVAPQPVCEGDNITAAVDIISENGSAVTAIVWKLDGTEIGNTADLSYPANYADNGKTLTAEVTNAYGTTTSNPMTITVNRIPTAPTGQTYDNTTTSGTGNWADLVGDYTGTLIWYDVPTDGSPIDAPTTFDMNVEQDITYYVSQIVNSCESSRTAVRVHIVQGTSVKMPVTGDGIRIYPNPVQTILFIETETGVEKAVIYTVSGVKMAEEQMLDDKINVSSFPSGAYIIVVETKDGNMYRQLFMKK